MQGGTDLYLIDQHAAMERVMYEKIRKSFSNVTNDFYDLLIPFQLEFSVSEALLIISKMDEIKSLELLLKSLEILLLSYAVFQYGFQWIRK